MCSHCDRVVLSQVLTQPTVAMVPLGMLGLQYLQQLPEETFLLFLPEQEEGIWVEPKDLL